LFGVSLRSLKPVLDVLAIVLFLAFMRRAGYYG
jgi:hypothetical protein